MQPYQAPSAPEGALNAKAGQASIPVSSWLLAYGALAECGVGTADGTDGNAANPHINGRAPITPTWAAGAPGTRAYSVFPAPPTSCDQALAMQESLLCAADKMDALASAVGPTIWQRATMVAKDANLPEGPWTLPPLKEEDKHVVREIGLHLLANLAVINMTVPKGVDGAETCGERYTKALGDGAFAASSSTALFGVAAGQAPSFYPPLVAVDATSGGRIANARVQIEMHILRSSAGLALKLRDEAADAQTAVAWAGAASLPGTTALAHAWGFDDPSHPTKNTLAHVTRTRAGRLDLGSGAPDRACQGVPGSKLLSASIGALADYVTRDLEPRTDGQRRAVALVEGFGVVLPPSAFTTNDAALRAALVAQVVRSGTLRIGLVPGAPEAQEDASRDTAQAAIAATSSGDLIFALDRAFAIYRAITGAAADSTAIATDDPMVPARPNAETAPEVAALGGASLWGVSTDRVPAVSSFAASVAAGFAKCDQGSDLGVNARFDEAFQGVDSLTNVLQRRVVVLREGALASGFDGSTPLGAVLNGASAELRTRAGRRVMLAASSSGVTATLEGFDADELPSAEDDLKATIVMVSGPPAFVECATGARNDCPGDALAAATVSATDVLVMAKAGGAGVPDGGAVALTFPAGTTGALVVRGTTKTSGQGGVLTYTATATVEASGAGGAGGGSSSGVPILTVGTPPTTTPTSPKHGGGDPRPDGFYCTPGFSKTTYAPVGSELTASNASGEASWKYYIDAAQQAAARADQFGQTALDQQTGAATRREAAGDALTALCGDVGALGAYNESTGALSGIGIDGDGHLTVTGNDALADCLALPSQNGTPPARVDAVFLTNDPVTDNYVPILEALGCDTTKPLSPLCSKAQSQPTTVTHVGLNLATVKPLVATTVDCSALTPGAMPFGLAAVVPLTSSLPDALEQATGRIHFEDHGPRGPEDGLQWHVDISGARAMSSDPASGLFPGCLLPNATTPPNAKAQCDDATMQLSNVFRPGSVTAAALGTSCQSPLVLSAGHCVKPVSSDELRQLRWSIQEAMWILGGLSSGVPAGMFHIAVPVAYQTPTSPPTVAPVHFYDFGELSPKPFVFDDKTTGYGAGVYDVTLDAGLNDAYIFPLRDIPANWLPGGLQGLAPRWEPYTGSANHFLHTFADFDGASKQAMAAGELQAYFTDLEGGTTSVDDLETKVFTLVDAEKYCKPYNTPDLLNGDGKYSTIEHSNILNAMRDASYPLFDIGDVPLTEVEVFCENADDSCHWLGMNEESSADAAKSALASQSWNCFVSGGKDVATIPWGCVTDGAAFGGTEDDGKGLDFILFGGHAFSPAACPPSARAGRFVARTPAPTRPQLALRVAQALALSCTANASSGGTGSISPPSIASPDDIVRLSHWVDASATHFREQLASLHVDYVPQRVVDDFRTGQVGSGPLGGQRGAQVLELEKNLQAIAQGWTQVEKDLRGISSAIDAANLGLHAADISKQQTLASLAIQSLQLQLQRAQAVIQAATAAARAAIGIATVGGAAATADAAGAGLNLAAVEYYGSQIAAQNSKLKALAGDQASNQVAQVLLQLHQSTDGMYADALSAIGTVRSATAGALTASTGLRETTTKARLEAAKAATYVGAAMPGGVNGAPVQGSPADFVRVDATGDGTEEIVPITLNTVLRRQYDINQTRYVLEQAEARRLACLARVSVEQRIGVRLDSLKQPVGDLPPASWADSVGMASGFNVAGALAGEAFTGLDKGQTAPPALQKICPNATDAVSFNLCLDAWSGLNGAVQFVGDYVQRLSAFMTLYQTQNAIHEGHDTTVLSLANDILGAPTGCLSPSRNLVNYSGKLDHAGNSFAEGWRQTSCFAGQCLSTGKVPVGAFPPPSPPADNGISVLALDQEASPGAGGAGGQGGSGAGGASGGGAAGAGAGGGPGGAAGKGPGGASGAGGAATPTSSTTPQPGNDPKSVADATARADYQLVVLHAGPHTLSWWAGSLQPDSSPFNPFNPQPATTARSSYAVSVVAPDGSIVGHVAVNAGVISGAQWPERLVMHVDAKLDGPYAVIFHSVASNDGMQPKVAIADVQLEEAPGANADPTPYVAHGIGPAVQKGCTLSPADVRAWFTYVNPAPDQYAWVGKAFSLVDGITGAYPKRFAGKFAAGNDNYRIDSIAVNLVGTGVHACSGTTDTASCAASGYEQYGLAHFANNVPVLTFAGTTGVNPAFYFGLAQISRGRAVAAEKYFTIPLGSADSSVVFQPEFEKVELQGRPMTGSFLFYVNDSPTLRWEHLEDVQFVLKYTYWSAVTKVNGN